MVLEAVKVGKRLKRLFEVDEDLKERISQAQGFLGDSIDEKKLRMVREKKVYDHNDIRRIIYKLEDAISELRHEDFKYIVRESSHFTDVNYNAVRKSLIRWAEYLKNYLKYRGLTTNGEVFYTKFPKKVYEFRSQVVNALKSECGGQLELVSKHERPVRVLPIVDAFTNCFHLYLLELQKLFNQKIASRCYVSIDASPEAKYYCSLFSRYSRENRRGLEEDWDCILSVATENKVIFKLGCYGGHTSCLDLDKKEVRIYTPREDRYTEMRRDIVKNIIEKLRGRCKVEGEWTICDVKNTPYEKVVRLLSFSPHMDIHFRSGWVDPKCFERELENTIVRDTDLNYGRIVEKCRR